MGLGGVRSGWLYLAAGVALLAAALFSVVEIRIASRPRGDADALLALRTRDDLNVVFVLVDTLRADHLSTYGYPRPTDPTLADLASTGIRFANVLAQSSWTKCSMASLWLGAYPVRTGILRHRHAIPEAATLPAELFQRAGYRTGGIWRNGWVANNFGFAQGFDVYYRPQPGREERREMQRASPHGNRIPGTDLDATRAAIEFARAWRNERFFLYVHYMDVHQYLYEGESALFGTDYVGAYDNAIHWTDRNLNALLAELDRLDLLQKTLVVVASDHGEAFSEHRLEGHARNLYQEVTRTPLFVFPPFRFDAPVVVEAPVENVDLWPTVLDLVGLPPLPDAHGRSLVPLMVAAARGVEHDGADEDRLRFAQLDRTWGRIDEEPNVLVSVARGDWRLFHSADRPEAAELYDHARDPGEQRNLAARRPELVADLRATAEAYLATSPPAWGSPEERHLDELRLQQLRALGYVVRPGGAARSPPGPAPPADPPAPPPRGGR